VWTGLDMHISVVCQYFTTQGVSVCVSVVLGQCSGVYRPSNVLDASRPAQDVIDMMTGEGY